MLVSLAGPYASQVIGGTSPTSAAMGVVTEVTDGVCPQRDKITNVIITIAARQNKFTAMTGLIEAGLRLGNIPIYNLLQEFLLWSKLLHSDQFKRQFASGHREPIRTPLLIWGGMPEDLLTLILQRTLLGVESYVSVAVWLELGKSGRLTQDLNKVVRNPFAIKSRHRGTANCYYNVLPALVDPKYALKEANAALWSEVREFYKTVRNKILHGYQIGSGKPEVLYPVFDMFHKLYAWVNAWHELELQPGKRMVIQFGRPKSPGVQSSE